MNKPKLFNNTFIGIIDNNDNYVEKSFGNEIFTKEREKELLSKIFNSDTNSEINMVVIGQVDNSFDTYYLEADGYVYNMGYSFGNIANNYPIKHNLEEYEDYILEDIKQKLQPFLIREPFFNDDHNIEVIFDDLEYSEMTVDEIDEIESAVKELLPYKFNLEYNCYGFNYLTIPYYAVNPIPKYRHKKYKI